MGGVLGAIKGKISLIVKKAEVNYNGNGESNIDIQIEVNFKDLSKTVVGMILQFAPAFEGFDVRVTGETGEVIYSVLGDITELIKKNKLDESGIKNLNYNIMLKSENKKEGKIVEFNVIRTGDGGIYQVLHVLSLEQTKEFVKELIKKFQNTKVNLHTASCVASRRTQTTSIVPPFPSLLLNVLSDNVCINPLSNCCNISAIAPKFPTIQFLFNFFISFKHLNCSYAFHNLEYF